MFSTVLASVFIAGLGSLLMVQREMDSARQIGQVRALGDYVLGSRLDLLAEEYAKWDDAYRNLVISPDRKWFHEEIGSSAVTMEGRVATLLVTPEGRPLQGSWEGRQGIWMPSRMLGGDFYTLLGEAREAGRAIGFLSTSTDVLTVGISRVRPHLDLSLEAHGVDDRFLVFVDSFDHVFLDELEDMFGIDRLSLDVVRGGDQLRNPGRFDLTTPSGSIVGRISLDGVVPVSGLIKEAAPVFGKMVAGISLFVGLSFFLMRRSPVWDSLREGERQSRDHLTGLMSREAFPDALQKAMGKGPVVAIALDIENFRVITNRMGYPEGGTILREVTRRIEAVLPKEGCAVRMGENRFILLVPGSMLSARDTALDLRALASRPVDVGDGAVSLEVTVGFLEADRVGCGQSCSEDISSAVLHRASLVLTRARAEAGTPVIAWGDDLEGEWRAEAELVEDMRRGLKAGEFRADFQPVMDAVTGRVAGVEALCRWEHPSKGSLNASEFIPVAEKSQMVCEIGLATLREACEAMAAFPGPRLMVNFSPVQMLESGVVGRIEEVLFETGFDPARLELEITETWLVEDSDRAQAALDRLSARGVRIVLAGFGDGFTSLGHLKRYPLSGIKIARSYTKALGCEEAAPRLVRAMADLARARTMSVTAEAIESRASAEIMREAGCDRLQGYWIARPGSRWDAPLSEEAAVFAFDISNPEPERHRNQSSD